MNKFLAIFTIGLFSLVTTAQTVVFLENFETGTLNSFTAANVTGTLTWQATTNRGSDSGHSSANSAYFGDPILFNYNTGNPEGANITTGPISLMGYDWVSLSLNYFLETENFPGFDIASIELSSDGFTFTPVANNSGLLNMVDGSGQWKSLSLDASSYGGGNLYIRISFNTVDGVGNGFEGFYIDDIEVTAFNTATSFLYNKTIGTPNEDKIHAVSTTADGGLLMVGEINTPIPFSIVYKTNLFGDTVWSKRISNFSQSPATLQNVFENSDGTIIASGIVGGSFGSTGRVGSDIGVFKLTANGSLLWNNRYSDMYFTPDVTVGGATRMSGNNILVYGTKTRNPGFSVIEPFLFKLNANGDTLWSSTFEFLYEKPLDAIELTSGDIITICNVNGGGFGTVFYLDAMGNPVWRSNIDMDTIIMAKELTGGNILICGGDVDLGGNMDAAITVINSAGSVVWAKRYGSPNYSEIGKDIIETSDGGYAMAVADNSTGSQKFGLYKLSSTGGFQWAKAYGGDKPSDPMMITEYLNGDFLLAGNTTAFGQGLHDAYMVRTNKMGITVGCQESLTNIVQSNLAITTSTFTFNILRDGNYGIYSSQSSPTPAVYINDAYPTIVIVPNNPQCNGGFGSAGVNVIGGANPYSYQWSSGINSQTLINAGVGTYSLIVVDNNGCMVHDTVSLIEPTQISATLLATNVDCFANFNGAVDLTVSGGTPGYTYQWGNGATTEDISGVGGGFYQVTITDNNGCLYSQGISVFEPGPLNAGISATQNVSCNGLCDGQLAGFATGGTAPYNYLWNDAFAQTNDTASNLCYGNYLLTIADANGCNSYANALVSEPLVLEAAVTTWASDCFASNGSAMVTSGGGVAPYTYSWNGAPAVSNDSIGALPIANYNVDVIDANGCVLSEIFSITSNTNPIEICVVTVDSLADKNMLVWTKPVAQNIQGFYIYRNIAGAYSQVGYQPYDSISQYVDNSFGVDPAITSYRYKISVLDSCGNESSLSNFHETIHLTSNLGLNGEVNLIWDDYEGFVFTQYNVLRDSTGIGDWEIIANVSNTSFTYTDLFPPQSSSLRYVVEVVLPSTCSATKAQDHNSTRSNRTNSITNSGSGTTINELILSQVRVFPNPSNGMFTIKLKSDKWNYHLYDMSGKLIADEAVNEMSREVDIHDLESGVYLLRINLNGNYIYKKIIRE